MGFARVAVIVFAGAAVLRRARHRQRSAGEETPSTDAAPATDGAPPVETGTAALTDGHRRDEEGSRGDEPPHDDETRPRRGRGRRHLATIFIVLGALLVAYAAATALWRDPITDLYARWQQHRLGSELADSIAEFREDEAALAARRADAMEAGAEASEAALRSELVASAKRFDARLKVGEPIGRIIVPRMDLNKVFVHGTRWAKDLSRGPGHYLETGIPAVGKTVAIAGHRTTFGAPFRYIDKLRRGDDITLELPYGTFHYEVIRHKIVDDSDWSIIDPLGFDALVLSACHPLYSAAQRWVVFARLAWVETMNGRRLTFWHPVSAAAA